MVSRINKEPKTGGWGNFPVRPVTWLRQNFARKPKAPEGPLLARGLGRSYGDACLAPHLVSGRTWRRFLDFNPSTKTLVVEGGVSLEEILFWAVPKGFFLAVTPGTRYVTVAGALAADVHGKNHHQDGAFSNHVVWFDLLLASGKTQRVTRQFPIGLFAATSGGMGLTGIILRVALTLVKTPSAFIKQQVERVAHLDGLMDLIEARAHLPFSMAWVDANATGKSLGRGHLLSGRWATAPEVKKAGMALSHVVHPKAAWRFPMALPKFMLSGGALKWLARVYHYLPRPYFRETLVHYGKFFYPLDAILDWNRAYGSAGFVQWQCVLPPGESRQGIRCILGEVHKRRQYAFVTVLKQFGEANGNPLSFPMKGYTFCMDFRFQEGVEELMDELDRIVCERGGRIYLAKDAHMSKKTFRRGYPQWKHFMSIKRRVDPLGRFDSDLARRLGLSIGQKG